MVQETSAGFLLAETAQEQAIKTIQRWMKKRYQRKVASSVKIQSFFRGCKGRKHVQHLKDMKSVDHALNDLEARMMIKSEEIFVLDTIKINESARAMRSEELKLAVNASFKDNAKKTPASKKEVKTSDDEDE
ncbi:hypothetical protein GUITHDRAFT_122708 [Guillardia theta CCMP2712]|uniref:Uncharacterized protein n=1 Tax=Guillardia theta (strain CCMP2712) TaxID=905079 RepID=L1I4R3_GUITC|nr:hypothetical protein GUITHDRAFT_122708 [Guillardia theta CCMP2712]EKX31087.1 hypothetical protein GUITHDRAFT_122708 [Guillardia theta CCMP2712]|eukprot:XP_005818067.1 hypothetical protein GUITHDRAFT_122708 [Guillardia theta CCMP2712]